jgi:hypothetical protein
MNLNVARKFKDFLVPLCLGVFVFFLFSFSFTNCAATSDKKRGKLSEAVEKSSDENEEDRKVADTELSEEDEEEETDKSGWYVETEDDYHDDQAELSSCLFHIGKSVVRGMTSEPQSVIDSSEMEDEGQTPEKEPETASFRKNFLGLEFITGSFMADEYSFLAGGGIFYARQNRERAKHLFDLGLGIIPIPAKSSLDGSVEHIKRINAGYHYRLIPAHIGAHSEFFIDLGGSLETMVWSYNNPVYSDLVDENGDVIGTDKITSDGIVGFSADVGPGFAFMPSSRFGVSLKAMAGLTGFASETLEAFENDLFAMDLYVKLVLEIVFGL